MSLISSVSSSTILYPIVVNGYICFSANDVQAAKNGNDPNKSNDQQKTIKQNYSNQQNNQQQYESYNSTGVSSVKSLMVGSKIDFYA